MAAQLRGRPTKRANPDEVRDPRAYPLPGKLLEHLLVATDLMPNSHPAIERAMLLAGLSGAQVTLLHVIENTAARRAAKDRCSEAHALLREQVRRWSGNGERDVSTNVRVGEAFLEIAREAIELGTDAIILGASSCPSDNCQSSTLAADLVGHTDRPVLIVRQQQSRELYRRVLINMAYGSRPALALGLARRFAPSAGAHVVDICFLELPHAMLNGWVATQPSAEARLGTVPEETRLLGTPDQAPSAALVLDIAARDFGADILVIELAQRAAGGLPLEMLRGLATAPPCDLLLARTQSDPLLVGDVATRRRLRFEGP
jgi:nucleotide-binding universal stress UspA family protein